MRFYVLKFGIFESTTLLLERLNLHLIFGKHIKQEVRSHIFEVYLFNFNGFIEIQPFFLYFNREEPWLNIPSLLFEWLNISKITLSYLFRLFNAFNQPMVNKNIKLVSFFYLFL